MTNGPGREAAQSLPPAQQRHKEVFYEEKKEPGQLYSGVLASHILTPIFVIGEVAFDVLIPLMTGKLLDEGVNAAACTILPPTASPWWEWLFWR